MKLNYSPKLAYSPAFTSIMSAFVDLLKAGQTNPRLEFGNLAQVVYMTDDNESKVLGASVFNITPESEGIIMFSFVDPEYRNQGLYMEMYNDVEKRLISQGAVIIGSGTWIDNLPMRKALESTGRKESSVRGIKWLQQQIPT